MPGGYFYEFSSRGQNSHTGIARTHDWEIDLAVIRLTETKRLGAALFFKDSELKDRRSCRIETHVSS
jgi:hypothetical protein